MKFILRIIILFCLPLSVQAQDKKTRISQVATVKIDGAAVYKVPNFDSPIVSYLNKGRKVRVSKKKYTGIGGLGSFYKVRYKGKKFGYVTDVDVVTADTKKIKKVKSGEMFATGEEINPSEVFMGAESRSSSVFAKRYLGLSYNFINYKEELANVEYTDDLHFYGIKLSGPGALFINLPLELNIKFSFGSPTYYSELFEETSGFIILADVLYLVPIIEQQNYMLYVGFGPMLRYSSHRSTVTRLSAENVELDLQFINLGVSAVTGFGYMLSEKYIIKAEAKYIYEEQSLIDFGLSFQMSY